MRESVELRHAEGDFFGVKIVNAGTCDGKVDIRKATRRRSFSLGLIEVGPNWLIIIHEPERYAAEVIPSLSGVNGISLPSDSLFNHVRPVRLGRS